jgi:hypothetical protein
LAEFSDKYVVVAGISPFRSTVLSDPGGFKTIMYKKKTATRTHVGIAAVNKVKLRGQPIILLATLYPYPSL